ncbi:MAG: hypothetical protein H3C47_07800 [Candidatus Cloacimonetes bacterium]|nr:hypothetical protein [Candidatus Cloacimonadota bacterium]
MLRGILFLGLATFSHLIAESPSADGIERTQTTSTTPSVPTPPVRPDIRPDRPDWEYSADAMSKALMQINNYLSRKFPGTASKNGQYYHLKYHITGIKNVIGSLPKVNRPIAGQNQFYSQPAVVAVFLVEVEITQTLAAMSNTHQLLGQIQGMMGQQAETPQTGRSETVKKVYAVSLPMIPVPLNLGAMNNPMAQQILAATGAESTTPQVSQEDMQWKMAFPSNEVKIRALSEAQISAIMSGQFPSSSSSSSDSE